MKRVFLLVLALALVCAGTVFGQTDADEAPKNTVTLDIGPTIIGFGLQGLINWMTGRSGDAFSFGIAGQYERQILSNVSVGGRIAYLGCGIEFSSGSGADKSTASVGINTFSAEAHGRFYPTENKFFLDGMLGYGYMSLPFSGSIGSYDKATGTSHKANISFTPSRNYLLYGAKIGWRIDFGEPGGFIFEPSFGWYGCVSFSDTFGNQLITEGGEAAKDAKDFLDEQFMYIEKFVFVGGPRLALNFGWRF